MREKRENIPASVVDAHEAEEHMNRTIEPAAPTRTGDQKWLSRGANSVQGQMNFDQRVRTFI